MELEHAKLNSRSFLEAVIPFINNRTRIAVVVVLLDRIGLGMDSVKSIVRKASLPFSLAVLWHQDPLSSGNDFFGNSVLSHPMLSRR